MVTFYPNLLTETQPLITKNGQDSNFTLPFEGLTKEAFPMVNFQQPKKFETLLTHLISLLNGVLGVRQRGGKTAACLFSRWSIGWRNSKRKYCPGVCCGNYWWCSESCNASSRSKWWRWKMLLKENLLIQVNCRKDIFKIKIQYLFNWKEWNALFSWNRFNVLGALNLNKNLSIVGHADDLCYVFQYVLHLLDIFLPFQIVNDYKIFSFHFRCNSFNSKLWTERHRLWCHSAINDNNHQFRTYRVHIKLKW